MTKNLIATLAIASVMAPFAAFAQGTPTTTTAAPAKPKTDFACVQSALDKREDAIAGSFSAYSTAVSSALSARKAGLHDAWGKTTAKDRQAARNSAWSTYRASMKAAQSNLKSGRNAAWTAFGTDAKACKTPVAGERKENDQL